MMKSICSKNLPLRSLFTTLAICFLASSAQPQASSAQPQDVASRIQKIAQANSLELPGKIPFHLKMSFQLYDLAGKPSDIGILEEWWAAPGQSRTTIIASSLKQTEPSIFDDSLQLDPREKILLKELLRAETKPLPAAPYKDFAKLDEKSRKFDKTTLRCLNMPPHDNSSNGEPPGISLPRIYCTDPATDTLLIEFTDQSDHTITRKDIGVFHETSIPLETQVSYAGRLAIVGKVVQIKSFDPLASETKLSSQLSDLKVAENDQHRRVHAKAEKIVNIEYPETASNSFLTGSVLLSGMVTKRGTVEDIFAIASSSPLLTGAAVDALSKSKFTPSSLDGEPTEERIFFESNFTISRDRNGGGVRVEGVPHFVPSPH